VAAVLSLIVIVFSYPSLCAGNGDIMFSCKRIL